MAPPDPTPTPPHPLHPHQAIPHKPTVRTIPYTPTTTLLSAYHSTYYHDDPASPRQTGHQLVHDLRSSSSSENDIENEGSLSRRESHFRPYSHEVGLWERLRAFLTWEPGDRDVGSVKLDIDSTKDDMDEEGEAREDRGLRRLLWITLVRLGIAEALLVGVMMVM